MDRRDAELSADDQAILLLCSRLGAPAEREAGGFTPYTLGEWNALARRIRDSALKRPGALLGLEAAAIADLAQVAPDEAERIARLLERGGMLGIELERLASLGIRATTRASIRYPSRLREKLRELAPPLLFYSGDLALSGARSLAVVGSRDVDAAGEAFAERISRWAARVGLIVCSGAARGVDVSSMRSAFEVGGAVVGVPADSLERLVRQIDIRSALADERLLLLTPYHPRAPFSIGNAMGRNKLIYCLADWALVVAAEREKGGTWAGAVECLRAGWTPLFARSGEDAPDGNRALLQRGARPLPSAFDDEASPDELFERPTTMRQDEPRQVPLKASEVETRADGPSGKADWATGWESFLEEPRSEEELAERFGLSRAELRGRLKELVDRGRVRKSLRPVRYQLVPMAL